MRKIYHSLLVFFLLPLIIKAQKKPAAATAPPKTYAVVVGISSYSSEIVRLDYAHRDAEEFARFLKSDAGGAVPPDNIRLLLNEEATFTAVYNSLYWLLEVCQPKDKVYFYFSGHGDIENSTIYKMGFLLAANTPRFNYINNAIRVEDLNNIANTLSADKKARVILITDACRSGKLAGADNRGNFLVGEQLRDVRGNEIRITSCGPDELSNEDPGWAGGRGVFSYYLLRGLEGMADASGDRLVTLDEIKSYLKVSLANDRILKEKEHPQHPVISGDDKIVLTQIVPPPAKSVKADAVPEDQGIAMISPAPLGISPQGYVLGLAKGKPLEKLLDFNALEKLSADRIPFACIDMLVQSLKKADELDSLKVSRLISSLKNNKDALRRFNDKLVEGMADRGQEIINLYLEGDESEIEKRRYYNSMSNQYAVYPKMFTVALKLVDPQNRLAHLLRVKYHYFSGVTLRLRLPTAPNPAGLLDSALREQLVALKLEENAAYIYNELGILYRLKKDNKTAERYYIRATQLAPTWALPLSNLSALYAATGQLATGLEMAEKALLLQPLLQTAFTNKGLLHEKTGNLLLAEEYYLKSIRMNSRHYYPFERMGYVSLKTTRYATADSNFVEAEKRKKGFNFLLMDADGDGVTDMTEVLSPMFPCAYDTARVKPDDVIGQFFMGLKYVWASQPAKAEQKFKQVIQLDPAHPLAYHELGKLLYDQQRWKEGDIIFNEAIRYHLSREAFGKYCDSVLKVFPQYDRNRNPDSSLKSPTCAFEYYKQSWVEKKITRFFLGTLYEKWHHFSAAETQFRNIISEDPFETAAYIKCTNLLERNGRFHDAENLIRMYPEPGFVQNELAGLYRRITQKNPEKGEWFYKAGSLMYDLAKQNLSAYAYDRKEIRPDDDVPVYRDKEVYTEQEVLFKEVPGTGDSYEIRLPVSFPITEGIDYFLKAARLIPDWNIVRQDGGNTSITDNDQWLAEISFKTGDLYVWQGLPELAESHYKKSMERQKEDADIKIKYVYAGITNYNFSAALEVLDTLYQQNRINFPAQLLMARFCIHAGRFADGKKLLAEAAAIQPFPVPEITDLNGRLELLANRPLQAIPFYQSRLAAQPNDKELLYTLARLYALSGNRTEAWKWLSQSLQAGFDYYWVLKYDETWEAYRSNRRWNDITKHVKPR